MEESDLEKHSVTVFQIQRPRILDKIFVFWFNSANELYLNRFGLLDLGWKVSFIILKFYWMVEYYLDLSVAACSDELWETFSVVDDQIHTTDFFIVWVVHPYIRVDRDLLTRFFAWTLFFRNKYIKLNDQRQFVDGLLIFSSQVY